jgi:hypothetical protein
VIAKPTRDTPPPPPARAGDAAVPKHVKPAPTNSGDGCVKYS